MDSGVVVGAHCKGVGCEAVTLLKCGATVLLLVDGEELLVVVDGWHYHHVVEVLGGGTDKADASDVDFLDNVLLGGAAGDGLLEGVEVDDDQVDLRYLVLCQLLAVAEHVAARQYAAEHLRVQSLDAAAKD